MINLAFSSDQKSTWDGQEGEKIEFEKKLFVREVKKGDVQKIFHDFFTVLLILLTRSI